jgi:hypothetical protein
MKSKKFDWNSADTKAFLREALKVSAPYLIVIIPVLIDQLPKEVAWASIAIFLLQRARSVIEIYLSGKK